MDSDLNSLYEPTVSVIVPAINAEKTIGELLDSLTNVEYDRDKLEIIVVDGGSTDRTREIIQSYPVKLVVEKKKGLNVARNTGVKNSTGEIVLFTDSDCVVPRDWIKQMVKNFRDEDVGCVGGNVSRYEDNFLSRYADESIMPVLRRFSERKKLENVELPMNFPAGCNMAFRRDVFDKVGGFDEEIHYGCDEDEFVERVCNAGYRMVLDPEVLVRHKHRTSLRSLLKQTFSYGKGGMLLLRKKGVRYRIARWNAALLAAFLAWLFLSFTLAFISVLSLIYLVMLLLFSAFPFVALVIFYAWKRLRRNRIAAVAYACLDVLRLFAYCSGEIAGIFYNFKSAKN